MTYKEWEDSTPYTLPRKDELRRSAEANSFGPPDVEQCEKVLSFEKGESYPDFKYPRWINSRSDAFKAYSGRFFKSIEMAVFELPWFIKHVPVRDRPMKIASLEHAGCVYWATDYTSFEASFSPEIMKAVECQLYEYMLQNYPDDAKILIRTLAGTNSGRSRDGVSFKLKGRRMSGDMCTSLGNGFTNLMIWGFLCEEMGMIENDWQGFVEGDDGIFATPGPAPSADMFAELGFNIKIVKHDNPNTASFCGIICRDGQNIRDPMEWVSSFGWSATCMTARLFVRLQLLRAKALSALWESPQCPVIGAIARAALRVTRGVKPRFINDGHHGIPPDEFEIPPYAPTPSIRALVEEKFGVTIAEQISSENYCATHDDMSGLECILPDMALVGARTCAGATNSVRCMNPTHFYWATYVLDVGAWRR
jgi:hypothetical protein